jgi:GT2 family glycosyltransferase
LEQGPLVSVVIPAYMAAARIRETLDSVYAQTYPNFEILLVNDGSPDTERFETAIQGYDERLIYLKQENQGPSSARNTAIRAARGKYVACLDSDDIFLPEHLQRMVKFVESNNLDLAYCDVYCTGDNFIGKKFDQEPQDPPVTFDKILLVTCSIPTSGMMASRQAMVDAGLFDDRFRRCEDFDLWLRMAFRGARIDFIREVGIEHRSLADGLAADSYLMCVARIEIYEKTRRTLSLSQEQKAMIDDLIELNRQRSEMELMRQCLRQKRYAEARAAARNVARRPQNMRHLALAYGVQLAPWAMRRYMEKREERARRGAS